MEDEVGRLRDESFSLREELVSIKCRESGLKEEVEFLKNALQKMEMETKSEGGQEAGGKAGGPANKKAAKELKEAQAQLEVLRLKNSSIQVRDSLLKDRSIQDRFERLGV